jgi:Na+-driven multidrug efflux pump
MAAHQVGMNIMSLSFAFGVLADQMSRFIFATIRFKQGKWVKIKI